VSSAARVSGAVGEWFHTSIGVRQGCLLSHTLVNMFLERIMTYALEDDTRHSRHWTTHHPTEWLTLGTDWTKDQPDMGQKLAQKTKVNDK